LAIRQSIRLEKFQMDGEKVKVLYIGGYGRSGSTLLERMLAQIDGFVAVGELTHMWERGFKENQLCGCGEPFAECHFWDAVMREAFGGRDRVDADHIVALRNSVERMRYIPQTILPWRTARYARDFQGYGEVVERLYRAIRQVSGAGVIVDSSKDPRSIYPLSRFSGIDLHILHLVRDSRAVAFSWSRKRARPEVTSRAAYMPQYGPARSGWQWVWHNALIDLARRVGIPSLLVRYEDLVTQPRGTLVAILKRLGLDEAESAADKAVGGNNTVSLSAVSHTVAGNPVRFEQGSVKLVLDREWREKMPRRDRMIVTALTMPLLLRYGYRVSGGGVSPTQAAG
jgi:hypothetical protein